MHPSIRGRRWYFMKMSMTISTRCIEGCLLLRRGGSGLSPLVDARGSRLLGGDNWETLGGLVVLGGTIEDARWSGTAGSGGAAEFIRAAIGSGLRAGGGGAVLAGDTAATCEGLGGGSGGARSGVVTFSLAGDLTGGEGFRMGTAGIGRDMEDAGFTDDCVRGRTGVSGGLSLRITSGGRRGGRGAEVPILFFREGRLGAGGNDAAVSSRVGGFGGGTEGLAGTTGGFDGGTLRAGGIGAEELSDFGIDGGFPRVGGIAVM